MSTSKPCHLIATSVRTLVLVVLAATWLRADAAAPAPQVVTSIRPLHSLLAGLLQGVAEPRLLIDGRTPPWQFRPDPAQRQALAQADMVVWSGPELEPALAPLVAARPAPAASYEVLASDALKVLPARDDQRLRDPFYWLDSRNMLILLDAFAAYLIERDPDRAPVYERNWQRMTEALSAIDRALEYGYRDVSGLPVFFYHDTHQYFAQAYAMQVAGVVRRAADSAVPDTARLLSVRGSIQDAGRACLFTEQGLDEAHLDLLAQAGATVVELDSLGVGLDPGPDLYVRLMRANFDAISHCVRQLRPAPGQPATVALQPDISRSPDRLMPRYLMADQRGRTVSSEDFRGSLQLIYFGYTFCPDVCPTSLAVMAQALRLLGEQGGQIQPLFITVDPERDTPQLLAEYVDYFHPRLLGLSASPEATRRVAESFRARYERVPAEDGDPRRYTMDHTGSLYLLGRHGEFLTKFAHGLPAPEVAQRLRGYLGD